MNLLEAIILGIIQGATEFLPVSSSGHLLLLPSLLNIPIPSLSVAAVVHEGTLLAVLIYFRQDLLQIAKAVWAGLMKRDPLASEESRLGWYIAIGSIPAAVAGLTLESSFERIFGTPSYAAVFLLGTAIILFVGERLLSGKKTVAEMGWSDALVIGIAQMMALLPGISRSGSTIAAGLWRGLDRTTAARYSFLLGVPAILGAGVLAAVDFAGMEDIASQLPLLLASFLSAAVTGYVCIHFLLSWLRQHTLYGFAAYCAVFGIVYLVIQ